jgi:hypothetical protein
MFIICEAGQIVPISHYGFNDTLYCLQYMQQPQDKLSLMDDLFSRRITRTIEATKGNAFVAYLVPFILIPGDKIEKRGAAVEEDSAAAPYFVH